jgi:segregation and condensation protein B
MNVLTPIALPAAPAATAPLSGIDPDHLRLVEALLFAAATPLTRRELAERLPPGTDLDTLLARLRAQYAGRGVNLVAAGDTWSFVTAPDLARRLVAERRVERRLSRAAVETLAIIAYQQPVTRAEIEEIRGVQVSKGTIDVLVEQGWIAPVGRRATPGRPVAWGTTDAFLAHFGLASLDVLPGADELAAAGFLDPAADAAARAPLPDPAALPVAPCAEAEEAPAGAAAG